MMPGWEATADVVVVGSGVAGLTAALAAARAGLDTVVVTKGGVAEGSTALAQGGVAVVLPDEQDPADSIRRHVDDTLTAGAGLCDREVVRTIVGAGPAAVAWLRQAGATFDADADGRLARTREGGHSAFRVVHAGGDATGAEVERALVDSARGSGVVLLENHVALDVVRRTDGGVGGLLVLDDVRDHPTPVPGLLRARAVVLATGGLGQLYQATTNPAVSTGDGVALALRAGAAVADLEFVQFHPTVLYTGPQSRGRRPLVTEAVRGEGAVLVDATGRPVMSGVHPLGDLAPRDVVAAAITRRLAAAPGGVDDHVYLDATGLAETEFPTRFPTVYAACAAAGIEPTSDPIPVAPAAHFACGGVVATVDGRTSLPGLYAVGEVARTGFHGANRLASNSLLEGLVVGERVARAVAHDRAQLHGGHGRDGLVVDEAKAPVVDRALLQRVMSRYVGIGRDLDGLTRASGVLDEATPWSLCSREVAEDAALTLVARALVLAAQTRDESRGCHIRHDHPRRDDIRWRRRLAVRLADDGVVELVGPAALGGAA